MIKKLHLLTAGVAMFMVANIINDIAGRPFYPITKMIYLSWEGTVATWYSSFLLSIGAYFSYLCYLKGKELIIERYHAFLLFSSLLLLMSIDEVAQLHETLGAKLGKILLNINVQQGVGISSPFKVVQISDKNSITCCKNWGMQLGRLLIRYYPKLLH